MHMWIIIFISEQIQGGQQEGDADWLLHHLVGDARHRPQQGDQEARQWGMAAPGRSNQSTSHSLSWLHLLQLGFFFILQKVYKSKYEKEKGKSIYNLMTVPPDVQHAMDVAKNQSNVRRLRCGPVSENLSCITHFFLFSPSTGFIQEGR